MVISSSLHAWATRTDPTSAAIAPPIVAFAMDFRRAGDSLPKSNRPDHDRSILSHIDSELEGLKSAGLYKSERVITSTQSAEIEVGGDKVLNFCANNYLGLADSAELREAAKQALDRYGYGMASVRFICGTQEEHKQLEATISSFLGMDDTILYGSCFDANGGCSRRCSAKGCDHLDALNHASTSTACVVSKRFRYANNDMADLEAPEGGEDCRFRLIATDGVFHGRHHRQFAVAAISPKNTATVMVDDSHAVGFVGKTAGRPSIAASRARWTSSPAHSARRWAVPRAAIRQERSRWSTGCASARGPICFPTRCCRQSPAPQSVFSS
jgi:hypothetical protein